MVYIPFVYQMTIFSVLNTAGSMHAWYMTRRRMMLLSGAVDTTVATVAAWAYTTDAMFSNAYAAIAALCASAHFGLHGLRTKALRQPNRLVAVYYGWCLALFGFGLNRASWVYTLRHD